MRRLLLLILLIVAPAWAAPELVMQNGHTSAITSMDTGPDGLLVTGSIDNTVKVWDRRGRVRATFHLPPEAGGIEVAISADGRTVATGSMDGSIRLWDVATARLQKTIPLPADEDRRNGPPSVGFAHDHVLVAALGHLYRIDTTTSAIQTGPKSSSGLELSRDRTVVATLDPSRKVTVTHLPDLKAVRTVDAGSSVYSWHFVDDHTLAVFGDGHQLALYTDGHRIAAHSLDPYDVTAIAVSPDGRTIVGADPEDVGHAPPGDQPAGILWVFDARTLQVRSRIEGGVVGGARRVTFAPDGRLLVGSGAQVLQLDAACKPQQVFAGHSRQVSAFSLKDRILTAVDADGTVSRWDLARGRARHLVDAPKRSQFDHDWGYGYVTRTAVSPDGSLVAIGHADGMVTVLDTAQHTVRWSARLLPAGFKLTTPAASAGGALAGLEIRALAFSPDGTRLAASTHDGVQAEPSQEGGTVAIFDASNGTLQVRRTMSPDLTQSVVTSVAVADVAFSPDGKKLAAVVGDKHLVELQADTLTPVTDKRLPSEGVSVTYGRDTLVVGLEDGLQAQGQHLTDQDVHGAAAVSPDGSIIAAATFQGSIELWQAKTRVATWDAQQGGVSSVHWMGDRLVSGGADGSLKFWSVPDHALLATAITLDGGQNWVVTSAGGQFDGSLEGQRLIEWRVDGKLFNLEQFFNSLYQPGLLPQRLSQTVSGTPAPPVDEAPGGATSPRPALKAPPRVHIVSPEIGDRIAQGTATVRVQVDNQGGGIGETVLFVNGHRVPAERGHATGHESTWTVALAPGVNVIRASAYNGDRSVESQADEVSVTAAVPKEQARRLFVLTVGVNRYKNGMQLGEADNDARALASLFKPGYFTEVKSQCLVDGGASKSAVLAALHQIAGQATPADTLVVHLAGHGLALGDSFFFLPWDADVSTEAKTRETALSSAELQHALAEILATRQLLVLDACHAGAATTDAWSLEKAQQGLAHSSGSFLISAADSDQSASEVPQLGHGLLTYAILQGLGEKGRPGAPTTSRGEVTVAGLTLFVSDQVQTLAEKYHLGQQDVVQFGAGKDFPLLQVSP